LTVALGVETCLRQYDAACNRQYCAEKAQKYEQIHFNLQRKMLPAKMILSAYATPFVHTE
jgi:hypothetical protein